MEMIISINVIIITYTAVVESLSRDKLVKFELDKIFWSTFSSSLQINRWATLSYKCLFSYLWCCQIYYPRPTYVQA